MNFLDNYTIDCPYCGEPIDLLVDYSIPSQEYTEDCAVCCQPIIVRVEYMDEDSAQVNVRREND